ncbi:MAG TPA: outer membrane beta-barrel protein [Opitutaceae bacterium]|nr:outer membrane beta-barrel protein [Opitutaceae bacterium]
MSTATTTLGSLWESSDWAVVGTMSGSVGYDSNLTLVRDGPAAYLIVANPYLTLTRRNSDTDIEINGGVTETEFADSNLPLETDVSLGAVCSYPVGDNVIPVYKLSASWQRSSQPNEFLGERILNDQFSASGEGYVSLTGKLGIRGEGRFQFLTFDSENLNDSYRGQAFVGLAYERTPGMQLSLNLGTALGRSIPNDPERFASNVRSTEFYVTTRVEGKITDKISGSAYGGFGEVSYTGGYSNRSGLPVAGADLTWGIDPRRTLVLAAYSGADYSPDGQAIETTRAFLSFTHVIVARWQYILRAGPTYTVFSRQVRQRTDDVWDFGAEFAYQPSDRFRVYMSLGYTDHNSTTLDYQFQHEVVSFGSTYRF